MSCSICDDPGRCAAHVACVMDANATAGPQVIVPPRGADLSASGSHCPGAAPKTLRETPSGSGKTTVTGRARRAVREPS